MAVTKHAVVKVYTTFLGGKPHSARQKRDKIVDSYFVWGF